MEKEKKRKNILQFQKRKQNKLRSIEVEYPEIV